MLIRDVAIQLFYVPVPDLGTHEPEYRVSLMKTGSAIKSLSVALGTAIAGTTLLLQHQTAAIVAGTVFAAIGAIGAWLQDCGKRNAM
jgi:hypothetical protein